MSQSYFEQISPNICNMLLKTIGEMNRMLPSFQRWPNEIKSNTNLLGSPSINRNSETIKENKADTTTVMQVARSCGTFETAVGKRAASLLYSARQETTSN